MHVIGTAGHVDHGKSTLVTALTGINPDRLKEEQAREMTIELGFAWLALPGGEAVGVVDVPGHRDFIENMLAGVGGIDAVLFVVAADEGVMPQTREHLAIIDLLQVPSGIIVITKKDLVNDPEWFDLLEMDIRQSAQNTILEHAPIVRVSARNGSGIEELKEKLAQILAGQSPRPDLGRPRLSVDRVFTMPGFGTVVTGTLLDGSLRVGEEVLLLPVEQRGRIRGLQTHKQKVEVASPGSRTAVNLSGVDFERINRGQVLTIPGKYTPSNRIDVRFKLQKDASGPIRHNSEVKLFLGAAEVSAKARLLGAIEQLVPGNEGWLQLELSEPVVAVRGDRYILRRPSPGETLGGGSVVDPHPARRHKRSALDVIQRLESLSKGSPRDILLQSAFQSGIAPIKEVVAKSRLAGELVAQAVRELIDSGELVLLETGEPRAQADLLMTAQGEWKRITLTAQRELQQYHNSFPLRKGMSKEELRSRLKLTGRALNAALRLWSAEGLVEERGSLVALSGHRVTFNAQQQSAVNRVLARFDRDPYTPPSVKECLEEISEDIYSVMIDNGELIQVSPEVVFRKKDYDTMVDFVRHILANEGRLTVAQFRDHFNSSRKYVLGFLEHLDAVGVTRREGDFRIAGKR